MKTFTVLVDDRLDDAMDDLKEELGSSSRAEVFRLAITMLDQAVSGAKGGLKIALVDDQNRVRQILVLPGLMRRRRRPKGTEDAEQVPAEMVPAHVG